jgi:hypothetical protein
VACSERLAVVPRSDGSIDGVETEAVAQLRNGLELPSGMPDDVARQEQELDLQIELGRALFATKGYAAPEAGEAFARARQQVAGRLRR